MSRNLNRAAAKVSSLGMGEGGEMKYSDLWGPQYDRGRPDIMLYETAQEKLMREIREDLQRHPYVLREPKSSGLEEFGFPKFEGLSALALMKEAERETGR